MQIKDNITATSNPKIGKLLSPIKMVKLRSKDIVAKNSDKLMEPTWTIDNKPNEVSTQTNVAPEQTQVTSVENSTQPAASAVSEPPKEVKEEVTSIPLTSEEVIRSKRDILGIEAYQDTESNIVNLANYQNARRLRVNEVVVGNANRERNINGIKRIKQEVEEPKVNVQESVNNSLNFSNLDSMNSEVESELPKSYEEPKYDNATKLDEWLNKETAPIKGGNDSALDEVNELQAKLSDNASSLATQKEILEQLRQRIANNEALVKARRQELEEENMNVTRELNDVLAEITKLTSIANEQEAFLGISNDEESFGKSRTA